MCKGQIMRGKFKQIRNKSDIFGNYVAIGKIICLSQERMDTLQSQKKIDKPLFWIKPVTCYHSYSWTLHLLGGLLNTVPNTDTFAQR